MNWTFYLYNLIISNDNSLISGHVLKYVFNNYKNNEKQFSVMILTRLAKSKVFCGSIQ